MNETESMALRPEATVHGRYNLGVIKWILIIMIKSSWISSPELSFVKTQGRVRAESHLLYAQILVLAIWYVKGVNSSLLCCNIC